MLSLSVRAPTPLATLRRLSETGLYSPNELGLLPALLMDQKFRAAALLFAEPAIAQTVRPYLNVHTGSVDIVGLSERGMLLDVDEAALITVAVGMLMDTRHELVLPAFERLAESPWCDVVTEALLVYRAEPDVPTVLLKYGLVSALHS